SPGGERSSELTIQVSDFMRKTIGLVGLTLCCATGFAAGPAKPLDLDFKALENTHDINLPAWGPYSKKYAGISHIPDLKAGLRFDVSVLPGYYRSKVLIPNVLFESGYYPWQINAAMNRVTYRYELEWKDKVFVDVTYSTVSSN